MSTSPQVYEVEKILNHSEWQGHRWYTIRWKTDLPTPDTNQIDKDLIECPDALKAYNRRVLANMDIEMKKIVKTVYPEEKFEDHRLPWLFKCYKKGTFYNGHYAYMVAKNRPSVIPGIEAANRFIESSPSDYTCVFAITKDDKLYLYSKERNVMLFVSAELVMEDPRFNEMLEDFYKLYHLHTIILETLEDEIMEDKLKLRETEKGSDEWKAAFRDQCIRKFYAIIMRRVRTQPLSTRDLWIRLREEYERVKAREDVAFCWGHVIGMAKKFFDTIFYEYEAPPPAKMSAAFDLEFW